MLERIEDAIEVEARKRLAAFAALQAAKAGYRQAYADRTGLAPAPSSPGPPRSWGSHPHFDPHYCISHSRFLAKGIWASLSALKYRPLPSLRFLKRKPDGGFRDIDLFSIPDTAIAWIFFKRLQRRTQPILSDVSYAFQTGKRPLQLVERLRSILGDEAWHVGFFDLNRFFDSIRHDVLLRTIETRFRFTAIETSLTRSILTHAWCGDGRSGIRTVGIPQGISLSVVLSNFALHDLDTMMERKCDYYFRYGDDILLINTSQAKALDCRRQLLAYAEENGFTINQSKSVDTCVIGKAAADVETASAFDCLGYRFAHGSLSLSDATVVQIKQACATVIYRNMLLYARRRAAAAAPRGQASNIDDDVRRCIRDLSRFIYGSNTEAEIRIYLDGGRRQIRNSGRIAHYCLTDGEAFRRLDGWLANCVWRAYRFRQKLSRHDNSPSLVTLRRGQLVSGERGGLRCPSFHLAWRAFSKRHYRSGLKA